LLDQILPHLEQHRIAHPLLRTANMMANGSEYDLPLMDDAIGRTVVTLDHYVQAPAAPRVFVSMREIDPVVRDRKLSQDARSIASIGMFNSVSTCVQLMTDLSVAAQTIEAVALDNLTFGDVDPLLEVARYHPNLSRQRQLVEYLHAIDYAIHQPFDQAHDTVVDPDNPFVHRLESDLATARAANLAALTDIDFALTYVQTLPKGPVRNAAVIPVIRSMGVDGGFDHRIQVLHLLSEHDPKVRSQRAASFALGCGTNNAAFAFRWFRDDVAEHDTTLTASRDWLGVFFARGLMRLSFADIQAAIILIRNEIQD
jgi:hypothetical protein